MRAAPDHAARNATLFGIGLMLASVFVYSLNNVLGKYLVSTMPVGQFLFMRSAMALLLLTPFFWQLGLSAILSVRNRRLQLLRTAISAIEITTFYIAVSYLPLADTMTFWLATPIYVTAVSAILLGERVGWRRWTAVVIGFCGVLLAMRPSGASLTGPALVGVAGGFIYTFVLLITRQIRDTPNALLIAGPLAGSMLLGLATAPWGWVRPGAAELAICVVIASLFLVGAMFGNRSLRLAPASIVSPFQYSQIVWGAALGYLAFGDVPHLTMIAGAVVIIGAGLYIFLRERELGRQNPPVGEPP